MQEKETLTQREKDVYAFYAGKIEDPGGMSPMQIEAARELGISPQMVGKTLRGLACKKYIRLIPGKNRNVQLIPDLTKTKEKRGFLGIFRKG